MRIFIFPTIFFLILAFVLGGCASKGFNRGELSKQLVNGKPVYDDAEIKAAFAKKPNLPKPFKLAVYFKAPSLRANDRAERSWRWNERDKEVFNELGRKLIAEGVISDAFPLVGSAVDGGDLKSLRLAAARHHADALLIVDGAADVDRSLNRWGWSYALLAPALFVPGSRADTIFMSNATLWDVRNEFLYLTAESEAVSSETYVAAFGKKDPELIDGAKAQALGRLAETVEKMTKGAKL